MSDDSITLAEYRDEVKDIATRVEERIEAEDDIHDEVWSEVDNHQWIIYYSYNMDVLECADNEPHEWKHMVADGDGWREVLQAMAYKALEADVYDALRDSGVY